MFKDTKIVWLLSIGNYLVNDEQQEKISYNSRNNLNHIIYAITVINAKGKSEEIRALLSSLKPYLTHSFQEVGSWEPCEIYADVNSLVQAP